MVNISVAPPQTLVLPAGEVPDGKEPTDPVALPRTLILLASVVPDGSEPADPVALPRMLVLLASVVPALTNLMNLSRHCFPFALFTAIMSNATAMASRTCSCLHR